MYVYFIHNSLTDNYKVGKTKSLEKRIKQLQTGNEVRLEIKRSIDDINPEIEKYLHEYFKDRQILNEWFDINLKEIEYVIELVAYANKIKSGSPQSRNLTNPKDMKLVSRILKWNPDSSSNINQTSNINQISNINQTSNKSKKRLVRKNKNIEKPVISFQTFLISTLILWICLMFIKYIIY